MFASRLFPVMPSVATIPVQDETATGPPIAAIPHGDDRGGEGPARSRMRLSDLFTVGISQPPEWGFHDAIGHAFESNTYPAIYFLGVVVRLGGKLFRSQPSLRVVACVVVGLGL